jgi:hypothetical protein
MRQVGRSGVGFIGFSFLLLLGNRFLDAARLIRMAEAAVVNRHFSPYSPGAQSYLGQSSARCFQ